KGASFGGNPQRIPTRPARRPKLFEWLLEVGNAYFGKGCLVTIFTKSVAFKGRLPSNRTPLPNRAASTKGALQKLRFPVDCDLQQTSAPRQCKAAHRVGSQTTIIFMRPSIAIAKGANDPSSVDGTSRTSGNVRRESAISAERTLIGRCHQSLFMTALDVV